MHASLIPSAATTLHNIAPIFLVLALSIVICLVCVLSKPILDSILRDAENERLQHGSTNHRPPIEIRRPRVTAV